MMTLEIVKDWLKTLTPVFAHYYVGKLDGKQEDSLGIYNLKRTSGPPGIALGGLQATKVMNKQVSLLIHGTKNNVQTEKKAIELYEALLSCGSFSLADVHVDFIGLLVPEPVFVDHDDNGIAEYVIEFEIYYRKESNE